MLALACVCAGATAAPSKSSEYKIEAAPAWVQALPAIGPRPASPFPVNGSVAYLLQDSQTRIEARGKVQYVHTASKALDGEGVQKLANVSINFDPSYQSLALHTVNVIRDGQTISKLATPVHVLQRETELDYLIYDGSKTASLLLDDVRIGDVVEVAYSLSGLNPVFGNKVSGGGSLEWGVPIEHAFLRVMTPLSRPLVLNARNTKLKPEVHEQDGYRDYSWDRRFVPELKVEKDAPDWYDPYAAVQWSEFADWSAVVQWAIPLYQPPAAPGPAIRRELDRIAQEHADPAARIAAVLRLVQREIRYLGIEVGPGSHAPSAPDKVFERRFGDCKDKALLTVAMLRALGVDAVPALVNTELTKGVADLAATPFAFNHVLVRVRHEGRSYWLDPTRAMQQGDLEHLAQADYGYALILAPQQNSLTAMAQPGQRKQRLVRSVFDSSAGLDKEVSLTVTTTLEGASADRLRAELARNRSAVVEQYLRYYAHDYPGIRSGKDLVVHDDERNNQLMVVESYEIPGFWEKSSRSARREATIHMPEIESRMKEPGGVSRNAPLRLDSEEAVTEVSVINLPERWNIKDRNVSISDPAFEFSRKNVLEADGRRVTLTTQLRPMRDHVVPGDMGNYLKHVKAANDELGYSLYYNDGSVGSRNDRGMRAVSSGQWAFVWYSLLIIVAGGLAFQLLGSQPEHLAVNRRLLISCTLGLAGVIPLLSGWIAPRLSGGLALVVLLTLVLDLFRLARRVPSSHAAYWLARHVQPDTRAPLTTLILTALRMVPMLVGWITIFRYLSNAFK
jgi:transglutaminase-like putative cysteine protease